MDGFVARHDDPAWKVWTPPCGYQCRCRRIALTDKQVEQYRQADAKRLQDPELAKARQDALIGGPDPGWDYSVCEEPTEGVRRAIERAMAKSHPALAAALQASLEAGSETMLVLLKSLDGAVDSAMQADTFGETWRGGESSFQRHTQQRLRYGHVVDAADYLSRPVRSLAGL
jgi:hypothetical protein